MKELTEKQKAISSMVFYDKGAKKHFIIDVHSKYTTNGGETAYKVEGQHNCYYTENVLMVAVYKGKFKQGLTDITSKPKN